MRRSSSAARGSVLPERSSVPPSLQKRLPVRSARQLRRRDRGEHRRLSSWRECERAFEARASRRGLDAKLVWPNGIQHAAFRPCGARPVGVGVERAMPRHRRTITLGELGAMQVAVRPIRGIAGVRCATIGKRDTDREPCWIQRRALDSHGDQVARGMRPCEHAHTMAVECKAALDRACPEVESLIDVGKIGRSCRRAVAAREHEPDAGEREPMRILTQPLACGSVLRARVRHLASVRVIRNQRVFQSISLRIGKGVPSPFGLRGERDLAVVVRERLKSGCVGGECEAPVADAQRGERIECANDRSVTREPRLPIHRWHSRSGEQS